MQPTILESTTNTSTSTPSANPRRLNNANLLCAKQCKLGASTLRKHTCLADMTLESFDMQHVVLDVVCEELSSMPDSDFQQLGLASHQPEDVALAAFGLLFLNPKHPQHQNIAPCQYNSSQICYQSSEIKRLATHMVSTQKCGWQYRRLMCLMVTWMGFQYLVC